MKKILFVLFTLFTLTSCGGDDSPIDEPIDPEQPDGKIEVQLSDVTLSLKIGEEKQLTYTTKPEYSGDVIWSSTNDQIVSVSDKGLIKGESAGDATISLKLKQYPNIIEICKVDVSDSPLEAQDKKIKTMNIQWPNESCFFNLEFFYDKDDRLEKVAQINSEYKGERSISYQEDKIIFYDYEQDDQHTDRDTFCIKLNNNGFIDNMNGNYGNTVTFEYTDNFLSKSQYISDNGSSYMPIEFIYSEGNLIQIVDGNSGPFEKPKFHYTKYDNKAHIFPFLIDYDGMMTDDYNFLFHYMGLYGKCSTKLEESVINNYSQFSFSYTFDKDGYPTKIQRKETKDNDDDYVASISYYE